MGFTMIATTLYGLEEVLADELRQLGASHLEQLNRAVRFSGDKQLMYRANLHLRTALRVLIPVHRFHLETQEDLYRETQKIDWSSHLKVTRTLAVDGRIHSSLFTHTKYARLRVKDAIVDQFRESTGLRPSVDVNTPSLRVHLHLDEKEGTILLDSSGNSLHRRGYRLDPVEAPLNEVLAAGMILLSNWTPEQTLIDPMCGSGTLLAEAGLLAINRAPGWLCDSFGFMGWKTFDRALWRRIRREARMAERSESPARILGSDISAKNAAIARKNITRAGLDHIISIQVKDFKERIPPEGGGVMITNPPYSERLEEKDIIAFYQSIGDRLKAVYTGWDAWILSGNLNALKYLGLKSKRRIILYNGSIECRLAHFPVYQGSRKAKYTGTIDGSVKLKTDRKNPPE
jgi:putative N6-adenine-specific DNA methylase